MKRIGILTSGGDCQALNAAMRGVAKALYENIRDVEIIGFLWTRKRRGGKSNGLSVVGYLV